MASPTNLCCAPSPSHSSPGSETEGEFGPNEALDQYEADCHSHSDLTLVLGQMGFVSTPPSEGVLQPWEAGGSLRRRKGQCEMDAPPAAEETSRNPRASWTVPRAPCSSCLERISGWELAWISVLCVGVLLLCASWWWRSSMVPVPGNRTLLRSSQQGSAWPADAAVCSGLRRWDMSGLVNGSQGLVLRSLELSLYGSSEGGIGASTQAAYAHLRALVGGFDWWWWPGGQPGQAGLVRILLVGPHGSAMGEELAKKDLRDSVSRLGVVLEVTCVGTLLHRDSFWLEDGEEAPEGARLGILGSILAGRSAASGAAAKNQAARLRQVLSLVEPAQVWAARDWMCRAVQEAKRRVAGSVGHAGGMQQQHGGLRVVNVVDLLSREDGVCRDTGSSPGSKGGDHKALLETVLWIHRYFTADTVQASLEYLREQQQQQRWQGVVYLGAVEQAAVSAVADAASRRLGDQSLFGGWLQARPVLSLVQVHTRKKDPVPPEERFSALPPTGFALLHSCSGGDKEPLVDRRWGMRALDIFCSSRRLRQVYATGREVADEAGGDEEEEEEGHPCYPEFCEGVWSMIGSTVLHSPVPYTIHRVVLGWQGLVADDPYGL